MTSSPIQYLPYRFHSVQRQRVDRRVDRRVESGGGVSICRPLIELNRFGWNEMDESGASHNKSLNKSVISPRRRQGDLVRRPARGGHGGEGSGRGVIDGSPPPLLLPLPPVTNTLYLPLSPPPPLLLPLPLILHHPLQGCRSRAPVSSLLYTNVFCVCVCCSLLSIYFVCWLCLPLVNTSN